MAAMEPVLRVSGLRVEAYQGADRVELVRNVDLRVEAGEIVGLVGESGSGKSMTASAVLRLQPAGVRVAGGSIQIEGRETVGYSERALTGIRGHGVGMVFQDPSTYLNPIATVRSQILEAVPGALPKAERVARVRELLRLVGLPPTLADRGTYPHELSGGMKQRALIAMALAGDPRLLIADEPTTALDVTVQAQILALLRDIRDRFGMGMLLITHDLGVVRHMCDRIYVMYKGETIESAGTEALFAHPQHPYTRSLIASTEDRELGEGRAAPRQGAAAALVDVRAMSKFFALPRTRPFGPPGRLQASRDVSLTIAPGESVALIGESGSGKTTIGRILVGLAAPSEGTVRVAGHDATRVRGRAARAFHRDVQMIFQNPYSSLNPIKTVGHTLRQPLLTHRLCGRDEADAQARELLTLVDLPESYMSRYPHQLSGGERQRVAIARAMAPRPRLVVADEPVSALDMAIRGQILRLLDRFRGRDDVSYLLITHDLLDAARLTDRVVVLYLGRIVEEGPTREVLARPRHPYTRALVAATLPASEPAGRRHEDFVLKGEIPNAADPPSGCAFRTRCPYAHEICATTLPEMRDAGPGRTVACHFSDEIESGALNVP